MEKILYRINCSISANKNNKEKDNQGLKIIILSYNVLSVKNKYIEIEKGDLLNANKKGRISKEKLNIIETNCRQSVNYINRHCWTENENEIAQLIKQMKNEINNEIENYRLTLDNLMNNFNNKKESVEKMKVSDYLS